MGDTGTVVGSARENIRKGFSAPGAKIFIGVFVVVLILIAASGLMYMRRGEANTAGKSQAGNFGVNAAAPRGATDPQTAQAASKVADTKGERAAGAGASFVGPFVFADAESSSGQGANQSIAVMAALRKKALDYDVADNEAIRKPFVSSEPSRDAFRDRPGAIQAAPASSPGGYGLSEKGFSQVTNQLDELGRQPMRFSFSQDGVLSGRARTAEPIATSPSGALFVSTAQLAAAASVLAKKDVVAVRAGHICPASPESEVNTDYSVPIFVQLVDCGVLTGSRMRGVISKSPDDFTLQFTSLSLDPLKKLRVTGAISAIAVSIDKNGSPGIADSVDNHWLSRIGSSALLALAKTEKQFISQRGSTTVQTASSSSTTIEPLSGEQRRGARVAGVMEGAFDVVTRDLSSGVNRQATMRLARSSLIGVQFMDDVRVAADE